MSNSVTTRIFIHSAKLTSSRPYWSGVVHPRSSRRSRNAPAAQGGVAVGGGYIGRGALACQQAFPKILEDAETAMISGFLNTIASPSETKFFGTAAFIWTEP
jgi:hypothetical protein